MPALDWPHLAAAVAADDWDAALALGLLHWDGDPAAPRQAGLSPPQIATLTTVHRERQAALAARARYQARTARLARLQAARQAATLPPPASATAAPKLDGAAAAALARALAKAKK